MNNLPIQPPRLRRYTVRSTNLSADGYRSGIESNAHPTGEWVKYEDAAAEIYRLSDALRMIAQQTLCPELWRESERKDWSEERLAHRTALVIAIAALEVK